MLKAVVPKLLGNANTILVCTQTSFQYSVLKASLKVTQHSTGLQPVCVLYK